ncbi:hypothetical protein GHT06_004511 [Daphnia sinensis]|uniref:Cadherin-like domain-containing protein n=1 Tax=Daphnia sinensis TaxID=1820382 RepID=A0AAD5KU87_9CRUS|nr:hypothetical protein GHT06_004511 [Daphnia sinensis]
MKLAQQEQFLCFYLHSLLNACLDTDSDGLGDLFDLDDDNDGLLDTSESGPFACLAAPSCVVNPSFSKCKWIGTPPTGWISYPNGGSVDINQGNWQVNVGQTTPTSTLFPNTPSGTYFIYGVSKNGSGSQGGWAPYGESFQQTINCLTVGNAGLSWATTPATARFVLIRDGVQVSQAPDQNLQAVQQTVSLSFTATSTSHTIAIAHTSNGANDISLMVIEAGSGFFCADALPSINSNLDTDNDGIPDRLDLDSDNDGCSDANETYNSLTAQGTDGNTYYGTGNPPATNADGTVIGASYTASSPNTLIAGSASVITTQPVNQTVNVTENAVFSATITAGSGTTSYQWQISTDGGATWSNVSNNSTYSGATSQTATIAGVGAITVRADGTFTFTPDPNYNGAIPSIDYTAVDANNGTDSGTLSLTLTQLTILQQ